MVCMGGPAGNWTPKATTRHRIDTEYTVCYTQYITPWPLTHPCCAPAFFSFYMAHDRRQRNEVFQKALRHLPSIKDIGISLDCYGYNFLKVEQVGSLSVKSRAWHWNGFWYITSPHNKYVSMLGSTVTVSNILVWRWNWCINGAAARQTYVMRYTHMQKWTPFCVK